MHSVYKETVNKYALGRLERVNYNLNLFNRIAEMQNPEELENIILENIEKEDLNTYKSEKQEKIWERIFGRQKND